MFSADVAYDRTHGYLADGFHAEWLANIARLRAELPAGTTLHPGHGEPCGLEVLDWQEGYIETVLEAVREADWTRRRRRGPRRWSASARSCRRSISSSSSS